MSQIVREAPQGAEIEFQGLLVEARRYEDSKGQAQRVMAHQIRVQR